MTHDPGVQPHMTGPVAEDYRFALSPDPREEVDLPHTPCPHPATYTGPAYLGSSFLDAITVCFVCRSLLPLLPEAQP